MRSQLKALNNVVSHGLSGKGTHIEAANTFAGLDWKSAGARPEGIPHSIFQLLNHMVYWQDWATQWLDGKEPSLPRHAPDSWPGGTEPANREEWEQAVRAFRSGLRNLNRNARAADLFAKQGRKTRLEMLQTLASHNSYHAGQVVLLRQLLGAWPPPSGGLTW